MIFLLRAVSNHSTAILISNFIAVSNKPAHSLNLYCMKPAWA